MPRFDGPGWDGPGLYAVMGWLLPLLMILILAALVIWVVLRAGPRGAPHAPPPSHSREAPRVDTALEEARLRYARGELSREEFQQLSEDLGTAPSPREG